MKHCLLAKRFYQANVAGRYLVAAQQVFPHANASVQHAYAMHMYCREQNAGRGQYLHYGTTDAKTQRVATIKLSTLQQYMPFVKPAMAQQCIANWHAYAARQAAAYARKQAEFWAEVDAAMQPACHLVVVK